MQKKPFALRFLVIVAVVVAFAACALLADAAPLGKKKKGVSSKKKPAAAASAKAGKGSAAGLTAATPGSTATASATKQAKAGKTKKKAAKKPAADKIVADANAETTDFIAETKASGRNYSLAATTSVDEPEAVAAPAPKNKKAKKVTQKALSSTVVIDSGRVTKKTATPALAKNAYKSETVRQETVEEYDLAASNGPAEPKAEKPAKSEGNFLTKYFGNSESRLKWMPGLYLNAGATVLENPDNNTRKMWTKLGLIPRISYDQLSAAYDLTFYFDENNAMRRSDWDSVDDYIRKIYYIYYGDESSRLHARVEMIDDLTLGPGGIFRNYCGSLRYPLLDKKVAGVLSWNSGYEDGAKFFVDDIASPGIYGVSAEITPHDYLAVGAQLVSDNKVNTGFRNDNVTVGSVHVAIPVKSKSGTRFKIYEEVGSIYNHGMGMHTGVIAEVNDLTLRTEFRTFGSNYIPNYFDTLYEMERHYKGRDLAMLRDNGTRYSGWFNEARAKISDSYTLRFSYEKDYAPHLVPHLSIGIDYTGMEYKKLKLSLNYDRKNLYYSNWRTNGAIYGVKARYDISDSSSVMYEVRRILNLSGREVDSINIETQLRF